MKRTIITMFLVIAALAFVSCKGSSNIDADYVDITTPYGTMRVLLYDDTPRHKQNFLQLAASGQYDSLLFHRVIRDFMIQGGDPMSKNASVDQVLGEGQIGDRIEAEFLYPTHIHKRGALAAAREPAYSNGRPVNPDKMSSGSQFYIVHGRVFNDSILNLIENSRNKTMRQEVFYEIQKDYADSLKILQEKGLKDELMQLQMRAMKRADDEARARGLFTFPDDVRVIYKTVGGAPHLDGEYTVFGEVISGFDVLDKIAEAATDRYDRPNTDVWMTMKIVE